MGFLAEVFKTAGIDEMTTLNGYQVINYNGEVVYVEGFKKVLSIEKSEIRLALKEGVLRILGVELSVFLLEGLTIIIKGEVKSIEEEGV